MQTLYVPWCLLISFRLYNTIYLLRRSIYFIYTYLCPLPRPSGRRRTFLFTFLRFSHIGTHCWSKDPRKTPETKRHIVAPLRRVVMCRLGLRALEPSEPGLIEPELAPAVSRAQEGSRPGSDSWKPWAGVLGRGLEHLILLTECMEFCLNFTTFCETQNFTPFYNTILRKKKLYPVVKCHVSGCKCILRLHLRLYLCSQWTLLLGYMIYTKLILNVTFFMDKKWHFTYVPWAGAWAWAGP